MKAWYGFRPSCVSMCAPQGIVIQPSPIDAQTLDKEAAPLPPPPPPGTWHSINAPLYAQLEAQTWSMIYRPVRRSEKLTLQRSCIRWASKCQGDIFSESIRRFFHWSNPVSCNRWSPWSKVNFRECTRQKARITKKGGLTLRYRSFKLQALDLRCVRYSYDSEEFHMYPAIAIHATFTAMDSFLANVYPSVPFTCIFSKTSSEFFPVLAVANTGSCVSPQNKIGHPAHRAVSSDECLRNR